MKKILLLMFSLGFIMAAQAQTITEEQDVDNNPISHYVVTISGVTDYTTAKGTGSIEYLEMVFGMRPVFNETTGKFEVDSRVIITLPELKTKLNEQGVNPEALTVKTDDTLPK